MVKFKTIKSLITNDDPLVRFKLLRRIAKILAPDYRFKWTQLDWWNDTEFNKYLNSYNELDGLNTDRRWMLYQLSRLVDGVAGDTAECGVFEGAGSEVICKTTQNSENTRSHCIFDSFEGLSVPGDSDGEYWGSGDMACSEDVVKKNLAELGNIDIFKGLIPSRFPEVSERKFCFVHIDVDLYQPTLDSIKFFYPRMNEGGIIVCDDYAFSSCPGATRAIDEYLKDKKEKMVLLSGGGGFLIKGKGTSEPWHQ